MMIQVNENIDELNAAVHSSSTQMQNVQNLGQTTVQQAEPTYDATLLSVRNIPETLLNHISNRYDFQYSLYDYLYQKGRRDTENATITGYEIDPDRKEATIQLKADDGTSITGLYKRSGSSFSYRGG